STDMRRRPAAIQPGPLLPHEPRSVGIDVGKASPIAGFVSALSRLCLGDAAGTPPALRGLSHAAVRQLTRGLSGAVRAPPCAGATGTGRGAARAHWTRSPLTRPIPPGVGPAGLCHARAATPQRAAQDRPSRRPDPRQPLIQPARPRRAIAGQDPSGAPPVATCCLLLPPVASCCLPPRPRRS